MTTFTNRLIAFQSHRLGRAVLALAALALISIVNPDALAAAPVIFMLGEVGSTATIDGLLKDYYDSEWVQEGVNNKRPLKDVIEDRMTDKTYGGRRVVYPFHIKRNKSPMAVAEYGLFASADIQNQVDVTVMIKKMMARTALTPEAIMDSASSEMAFEDAQENNFDRLVDDLARRDEMFLSYTGLGALCRINEATPSGSVTVGVDSPAGITGSTFGNRFLATDTYVGAINPATGGLRAGISKIASLSSNGAAVTFTAAPNAAWVDDDYLVKAANANVTDPLDTEWEAWMWGLLGIFDDGTYRANYGGVDRTVVDNVNTYVQANTGALSIDGMQMLADALDQRSGGITSLMIAHHSVRRLVIKLTQADRRYAGQDLMKPDSGTVAFKQGDITVGEVPTKAIRDFAYGTLLGLDVEMSKLRRYVSTKGEWVTYNGGRLFPIGEGDSARDAFEARYRMRYQYWAKFPAAAWRADGITGATVNIVRPLGDG